MNNNRSSSISKRTLFIILSSIDTVIGAIILLLYFGFLPIDISSWEIPRWVVGALGAFWFFSALGFLVYQLTRTDIS